MIEKFTKGGWQIALMDNRTRIVIESENTGYCIADIQDVSDTDKANASLIAFAPDMYQMLDKISDGLLEAGGFGNCRLAKEIEELLLKAGGGK